MKNKFGEDIIWKWGAQRLRNEAAALKLVAQRTTIPVPRVIACDIDEKGSTYLEVEYIDGITADHIEDECRMPDSEKHNDGGKCQTCGEIAYKNVDHFITTIVLPQLSQLKSNTTGLNGFVLPPPRITETQIRPSWEPKTSTEDEYVFVHGDLGRHNIMVSPDTLEVICIFDWEHGGFFPLCLEAPAWRMDFKEYYAMFEDVLRIEEELRLIT